MNVLKIFYKFYAYGWYILLGPVVNASLLSKKKIPEKNKIEHIGVFCRGPSLELAKNKKDFDLIILANGFEAEIKNNYWLRDVLKKVPVIHLGNRGEPVLSRLQVINLNVRKYQLSRFRPDGTNKPRRGLRVWRSPETRGLAGEYLPEQIKSKFDEFEGSCQTGQLAVFYASEYFNPTDISVFGMDFYENNRYLESDCVDEKNRSEDKTIKLKSKMKLILNTCENTQFKFYTYSTFSSNKENTEIHSFKKYE